MSPQLPPRPLGFHLFSLVTPVQLSLPMLTVNGWSTHMGLGNPLLTPAYHPSAMCRLMVPGGWESRGNSRAVASSKDTLISPETKQSLQ